MTRVKTNRWSTTGTDAMQLQAVFQSLVNKIAGELDVHVWFSMSLRDDPRRERHLSLSHKFYIFHHSDQVRICTAPPIIVTTLA